MMFVKALKEHDEALEVVRWLKEDLLGIVEGASELVDITGMDSVSKLSTYAHLFNSQAMKDFAQLTQGRQDVDAESAEWDEAADDNDRSGLELERMGAGTEERDVGNRLIAAVDKLEAHLIESIKNLEESEIRSAWDLS